MTVLLLARAVVTDQADSAHQLRQQPVVALDDIEMTARRGAALVAPEREYDGAAIGTFAAWDIDEVITRASERAGDRDPPVIINGERVADPSIFLNFPPDAMSRLELLPQKPPLYTSAATYTHASAPASVVTRTRR